MLTQFVYFLIHQYAWIKKTYYGYHDALCTAHIRKQQLFFLKKCLDNRVVPRGMLAVHLKSRRGVPFTRSGEEALKWKIEDLQEEVEVLFYKVRKSFDRLQISCRKLIGNFNLNVSKFMDCAYNDCQRKKKEINQRLEEKFVHLFRKSDWCLYSNPDIIVNLSNHVLTLYERTALGYGFSFSLGNSSDCIFPFLISFDRFVKNLKQGKIGCKINCDVLKGFLLKEIKDVIVKGFGFPKCLIDGICNLKHKNDIVVLKSDKGSSVVIMNVDEYDRKLDDLLDDERTYQKLRSDPLKESQADYNKSLKEILGTSSVFYTRFYARLSRLPYMYGLPKVHKTGVPLRPIVSTIGSCTYGLAKWLAKGLSGYLGTISSSYIKNSEDFVSRVKNVDLTGKKMLSFDVTSLFTNVPLDEVVRLLEVHMREKGIVLPLGNVIFFNLLRLALSCSFFVCQGKFFKQRFGLAMGNPLSPVLSGLFMEFFERDWMQGIWSTEWLWLRYVDDCFVVVPDSFDVEEFLRKLNAVCPSINFTRELEVNGVLPFLDVCVIRGENGFPKFKVHRKTTNMENYIHAFSSHSVGVKRGVICGLVLRALRLCSLEFLKEEMLHIRGVFSKLGYENKFIESAIRKAKASYYKVKESCDVKKNIIVVPVGVGKGREYMSDLFQFVNSSGITIKSLVKKKNVVDVNKAGVYCIGCEGCNGVYIGETCDVNRRMAEHCRSVEKNDSNSALVSHRRESGHVIEVRQKNSVIMEVHEEKKRVILEACAIRNSNNLNNLGVVYDLDLITNCFVKNSLSGNLILNNLDKIVKDWGDPG